MSVAQQFIVWFLCCVVVAILVRHAWQSYHLRSRFGVHGDGSSPQVDDLFEAAPIGYLEIDRECAKQQIPALNLKQADKASP